MAIPDFFQEFFRIFIQEISKSQILNIEESNTHKMTPSVAS
jgi:hypothetical protein